MLLHTRAHAPAEGITEPENVANTFNEYFTNIASQYTIDSQDTRHRYVIFDTRNQTAHGLQSKQSEQSEITTRVPQVSILVPLLFIVFMNDVPKPISNADMYADDSTISASEKNVQEIGLKLNNDLQEISNGVTKIGWSSMLKKTRP